METPFQPRVRPSSLCGHSLVAPRRDFREDLRVVSPQLVEQLPRGARLARAVARQDHLRGDGQVGRQWGPAGSTARTSATTSRL